MRGDAALTAASSMEVSIDVNTLYFFELALDKLDLERSNLTKGVIQSTCGLVTNVRPGSSMSRDTPSVPGEGARKSLRQLM
ncbi:MAG TPA: hypothetical protein VKT80_10200, partial [Chloroflexota bacterium]|nr:hypothetical protein [Chloroflexota bacterium]